MRTVSGKRCVGNRGGRMRNVTVARALLTVSMSMCLGLAANGQTVQRTIPVGNDDAFLSLPIKQSNDLTRARIVLDGTVLDEFTIRLAEEDPDFWTFFDVSPYRGETITLELDDGERAVTGLDLVQVADTFPGQGTVYQEAHRPQATFSTRRGWTNDPNGLVYKDGEYHLFYQHNPYGWEWGNMHWGHAVSTDLVYWEELPTALYTPEHEHMAFSGSAIVDNHNTSGLRRDGVDPLLAFYTRTGRGESLAMSYDDGRTFEEYAANPLVEHDGRDPKVIWYEPGNHWVMIVYDESQSRRLGADGEAVLYQNAIHTSPDLKAWTYQSSIPGFFECPELFEIAVEGQPGVTKWVMYDASGKYVVGDFDGKQFIIEQGFRLYDHGGAFYASQTYSNIPDSDGRRIQIGWFRGGNFDDMPFNQKMTFPTSLKLRESFDGYRLSPTPVEEIESLHENTHVFEGEIVTGEESFVSPVAGDVLHVVAEIDPGDAAMVGMDINGYQIGYDAFRGTLNDHNYVLPAGERLTIEVIVDKVGIEAFINGGEMYFVDELDSVAAEKGLRIYAGGGRGRAVVESLSVHELRSIWEDGDDQ